MLRYGDLVGCARPAGVEVGGAVASSERAAAAAAAGGGGPGAGAWRDPGRWPARRGSARPRCRDGCLRAGGGRRSRSRMAGPGGRAGAASSAEDLDPGLVPALLALVEPEERGDPVSPLRWTTKSLRHLAGGADPAGASGVGADGGDGCCGRQGFSLQANAKTHRGRAAPGPGRPVPLPQRAGQGPPGRRGAGDQRGHQEEGAGRAVASNGRPGMAAPGRAGDRSRITDFSRAGAWARRSRTGSTTSPRDTGWVNVGTDHDTAAFAVESIRRWWKAAGRDDYPARPAAADHRRRGRLQQLPHPGVEGRAGRPGRGDRAGDHRSATSRPARRSGTSVHGLAATREG